MTTTMKATAPGAAALGLALSVTLIHAQSSSATLTPANPAILIGQTQVFTSTGLAIPVTIAGGGYHTCMLMGDQSVSCFGENNWGQLGNGGFANASTPVPITGLNAVVSLGSGIEHSCALVGDGTVRCWGTNYVGQLGDGTFGGMSAVPKVVQGLSNVAALAVGGFHNCAVFVDRTVKCWGRNQDGQIGNGDSTTDVSPPQQPVTGLGPVASVMGGGYHTCALMPDATVRCWGRNARGQLGDGTLNPSSTPVPVSGMTSAVALSGGLYHTCALLRDHTVQCWGENADGQVGAAGPYSPVPSTVAGITNAVAVSAGVFHSCALLSDSTVRCWGQTRMGSWVTAPPRTPRRPSL